VTDTSVEAIESFDAPWLDDRPSIHSLVIDALGKRGSAKEELRIELSRENAGEIRWALNDDLFIIEPIGIGLG
jgi:hypothetical protein